MALFVISTLQSERTVASLGFFWNQFFFWRKSDIQFMCYIVFCSFSRTFPLPILFSTIWLSHLLLLLFLFFCLKKDIVHSQKVQKWKRTDDLVIFSFFFLNIKQINNWLVLIAWKFTFSVLICNLLLGLNLNFFTLLTTPPFDLLSKFFVVSLLELLFYLFPCIFCKISP